MRHPRWFLRLILILLVVNTTFFVAWYAFDVQGYVKGIVEREVSKALEGTFSIGDFSFNDRRLIARDIRFVSHDGSIDAAIGHVRIKYNLLKLLTSWFSIGQTLTLIEIDHASITYSYYHDPSKPPGEKFEIPDLESFFQELKLSHGELLLNFSYPLDVVNADSIRFSERLSDIKISVDNRDRSRVSLSAVTANRGTIEADALIDQAAIHNADIEIANYEPLAIEQPFGEPLQTEVFINLNLQQKDKDSPFDLSYEAILWNSRTSYNEYKIAVPFVNVDGDSRSLKVNVMGAMINRSSLDVSLLLSDLHAKPSITSEIDLKTIELSDFTSVASGYISGEIQVFGRLDDPSGKIDLRSDLISTEHATISDIQLQATYDKGIADLTINRANWEGNGFTLQSKIDVKSQSAAGTLTCKSPQGRSIARQLDAEIDFDLTMIGSYPSVMIDLLYFSYRDRDLRFEDYTGSIRVVPDLKNDILEHLLVDVALKGGQGIELYATGDILSQKGFARVNFDSTFPHLIIMQPEMLQYKPRLSGSLNAMLNNDSITGQLETTIHSDEFALLNTHFESLFMFDIKHLSGALTLSGLDTRMNGVPLSFNIGAEFEYPRIRISNLTIHDKIRIFGNLDLDDLFASNATVKIVNLNHSDLMNYLPDIFDDLPKFEGLNLDLEYNLIGKHAINLSARLRQLLIDGIQPLSASVQVDGDIRNVSVIGEISTLLNPLAGIKGSGTIYPDLSLALEGVVQNMALSRILADNSVSAKVDGKVSFKYLDILSPQPRMTIKTDLIAEQLSIGGLVIDEIRASVAQHDESLQIDTLSVIVGGMFDLQASGSLDYNLTNNTFYEGDRSIDLTIRGELFSWLKNNLAIIEDAAGSSRLICRLSTHDGQFNLSSGSLDLSAPLIKVAGQGEPITDLTFNARFDNNRVLIDKGEFRLGLGKVMVRNVFDTDPGDHFFVGFIDLGRFLVSTDHNGILINVPKYTTANTYTRAILRGRRDNFASIHGPFDDMKISAEVMISNSNVVYPSGTDNLLNLARTVGDAAIRRPPGDAVPMPFVLDLMLIVQNNVRYVTYPVDLEVFPGSFIHLVYDGNSWDVIEADFSSARGSLDFFGTVFLVEDVNVSIISVPDLMQINGRFYKRTPDGTTVTLTATTDKETDKDLLSRLEFNLTSDNPQDITVSRILSRLRYNRSIDEIDPALRQTLLQDEALNLIYGNINTSLLSPFLYPIENRVRRWLRLDSFSLSAGFIQNLLTQYTVSSDLFSDAPNLDQYNNDALLFSSAILLNNLSISAGKHLWRRIYADYQIKLQEETDIAQKKQIVVTHDTSLRIALPLHLRLGYTLQYKPNHDVLSHEIMLQRTFRF